MSWLNGLENDIVGDIYTGTYKIFLYIDNLLSLLLNPIKFIY